MNEQNPFAAGTLPTTSSPEVELSKVSEAQESPFSRYYSGDNQIHVCRNSKGTNSEDDILYYVRTSGPGRGQVSLLLTTLEYNRAQRRAVIQANDIPKPFSFKRFFSTLFKW